MAMRKDGCAERRQRAGGDWALENGAIGRCVELIPPLVTPLWINVHGRYSPEPRRGLQALQARHSPGAPEGHLPGCSQSRDARAAAGGAATAGASAGAGGPDGGGGALGRTAAHGSSSERFCSDGQRAARARHHVSRLFFISIQHHGCFRLFFSFFSGPRCAAGSERGRSRRRATRVWSTGPATPRTTRQD